VKILTIFTGGTIGSHVDDSGYISTTNSAPYKLIDMYKKSCIIDNQIDFVCSEPYQILSENLNGAYISKLSSHVFDQIEENPDARGIIITHGTDTLQYSAAMLSYLLSDISVPIILVSSAFVLDDPRANGLINFIGAVEFIKAQAGIGVFVSYSNDCKKILFHNGTRMITPPTCSADMDSIFNNYYASMDFEYAQDTSRVPVLGKIELNPNYSILASEISRALDEDEYKKTMHSLCYVNQAFELLSTPPILWLHIHPGISYPTLTKQKTNVVILESYHSGTLCIDDKLRTFLEQAKQENILVYLIGSGANKIEYETVKVYGELGIKVLPACTPISQYCKLWIALSFFPCNLNIIEKIMNTAICDDWVQ